MAVTRESLLAFFGDKFGLEPDELENDAPIFSQGLLDSFNLVDLVGFQLSQTEARLAALIAALSAHGV